MYNFVLGGRVTVAMWDVYLPLSLACPSLTHQYMHVVYYMSTLVIMSVHENPSQVGAAGTITCTVQVVSVTAASDATSSRLDQATV